jgi:hypothetical protein
MATTQVRVFQTGFESGSTSVRFGLLWPDGSYLFPDFNRATKEAQLDGIGDLTVIQLFGFGPRQVTYRLFFDTVAEFRALDDLQQQTGTLRIVHNGHTLPASLTTEHWIHTQTYSEVADVLLRSLVSVGVDPSGIVEADAVFTVAS